MRRSSLPAALVVLLLAAGCLGSPGVDGGTTIDDATPWSSRTQSDCPTAADYERRPLPDRPDAFTNTSVERYVAAHEEASVWNRNLDAHHEFHVYARARVTNRTTEGFVVEVSGGVTKHICDVGHAVGHGMLVSTYFVNESVVVRMNGRLDEGNDPRVYGEVVVRWGNETTNETA